MTAEYVELTKNVLSDLQCTQSNYSRGHNLAKHHVKEKVNVKRWSQPGKTPSESESESEADGEVASEGKIKGPN